MVEAMQVRMRIWFGRVRERRGRPGASCPPPRRNLSLYTIRNRRDISREPFTF